MGHAWSSYRLNSICNREGATIVRSWRLPQAGAAIDPIYSARLARLGPISGSRCQASSPAKGEARVAFIGDSITEAWSLLEFFPGKPYVNRGISGQTTSQILLRFRQDVSALKPKVVVILAGTNDVAENTSPIMVGRSKTI